MRQFLDCPDWEDHINQHHENLGGEKTAVCPHPQTQCDKAFRSLQELKFHLQDVHCVKLRKGHKRSSLESEQDTKPRKIKSAARDELCVQLQYKFVDEGGKLWS